MIAGGCARRQYYLEVLIQEDKAAFPLALQISHCTDHNLSCTPYMTVAECTPASSNKAMLCTLPPALSSLIESIQEPCDTKHEAVKGSVGRELA